MSYYKQIDGVDYDRALIVAAQEAVSGRGDGRISRADAEKLLPFVVDGGKITATEQATIIYLRDNFTWTDKASAWFQDAITGWEAGDRSLNAKPAASAPAASEQERVVIARIGSAFKTSSFFPADAAAAAQDGAVIILSKAPGSSELSTIWARTDPHKTADLSEAVEIALCTGAADIVRANLWRFSPILGSHQGMISWDNFFTNVAADTIVAVLKALNLEVIEADTLL